MSIKEQILAKLFEIGIDDNMITHAFAEVIQGKTVKNTYRRAGTKDGKDIFVLDKKEELFKPEDRVRGLIVLDILADGKFGIASENLLSRKKTDPIDGMSRKMLPLEVDYEIVSNKDLINEDE